MGKRKTPIFWPEKVKGGFKVKKSFKSKKDIKRATFDRKRIALASGRRWYGGKLKK